MSPGQIKTKILIIQLLDWSLLLAVLGAGILAYYDAENRTTLGLAALIGLYLVNQLGKYSITKISGLKMELKKLQRGQPG